MEGEETRIETLPCTLTEGELLAKADEAALLQEERDREEGMRDTRNKAAKAKVQGLEKRIHGLLQQVRSKSERREVQVIHRRDEDGKAMEVVRVDTGEVIRSRPLTPDELQVKLFPAKAGEKPAKA